MTTLSLPDPAVAAAPIIKRVTSDPAQFIDFPIQRIMTDQPKMRREQIVGGLVAFHKERLAKVPSVTQYPESKPWVEYALSYDRALAEGGLGDLERAIATSLHAYMMFRAYIRSVACDEKCRVAYIPESDRGQIHIKNVDDPITHWKRNTGTPVRISGPRRSLKSDGVGSGLHMDDEPDEIFPLPVGTMLPHYCDDVPSAVEFLTRYCKFWGGANNIFYDDKKRSVAIEKCSYNHIQVYYPGPDGRSHISGMTCRDPNSAIGAYQIRKRQQYVKMFGMPDDCPDNAFWATCHKFEAKLSAGLKALGEKATFDNVVKLFTGTWPEGLNKAGLKIHKDQGLVGYTLMVHASLIDERKHFRWQRSEDGKTFDSEPEVFAF